MTRALLALRYWWARVHLFAAQIAAHSAQRITEEALEEHQRAVFMNEHAAQSLADAQARAQRAAFNIDRHERISRLGFGR